MWHEFFSSFGLRGDVGELPRIPNPSRGSAAPFCQRTRLTGNSDSSPTQNWQIGCVVEVGIEIGWGCGIVGATRLGAEEMGGGFIWRRWSRTGMCERRGVGVREVDANMGTWGRGKRKGEGAAPTASRILDHQCSEVPTCAVK